MQLQYVLVSVCTSPNILNDQFVLFLITLMMASCSNSFLSFYEIDKTIYQWVPVFYMFLL